LGTQGKDKRTACKMVNFLVLVIKGWFVGVDV
jgi:hypothetical protein